MHQISTLKFVGVLACLSVAQLSHVVAEDAQPEKISLSEMHGASAQLEKIFSTAGLDRIGDFTKSKDPTVALHAAWESAKGKPAEIDRFLKMLETTIGAEPPKWWREQLKGIKIYVGNCHYVPGVSPNDEGTHQLTYKNFRIVAKPGVAGFPYEIAIIDTKTKKERTITVWAVGRKILAGVGVHQMEILIHNDTLCVFGTESHGAYAEQFRLTDGTPLVRFSSCYWNNFSERWNWSDRKNMKPAEVITPNRSLQPSRKSTPPVSGPGH